MTTTAGKSKQQAVKKEEERNWQESLYNVIFKTDTPAGKCFDIVVIVTIVLSVATVIINTVKTVEQEYGTVLIRAEWIFTILFTIEYGLRLICCKKRIAYACSFFGIVDLFAVIPTYISVLLPGSHILIVSSN